MEDAGASDFLTSDNTGQKWGTNEFPLPADHQKCTGISRDCDQALRRLAS